MKKIIAALLCAVLAAGFVLLPSCGGNTPDDSSAGGAAESTANTTKAAVQVTDATADDTEDPEESGDPSDTDSADGTGSVNTGSAGSDGTKPPVTTTTPAGPVYTVPKDDEIFPSKWTATKSVRDVPANLKANVKSGTIKTLAATKLTDESKEEMSATFKQLTGQTLKFDETVVEWNSLRSQLQTMVMAGKSPDVFSIYNGVGIYLRNKNLSRDINDYINMNDAAWKGLQSHSRVMYYNDMLTGVCNTTPGIVGGIVYNKSLIEQAGLDDPLDLYKKGKWTMDVFMEYVEELTVDANNDGVAEVFGVSMAPESIFRMALATGQDIVTLNKDGSFSNNLGNAVFTRYAQYARKITSLKSYDTESWVDKFIQGKVAMKYNSAWSMFESKDYINWKKQGRIGWVPTPKDPQTSTYYHGAEMTYSILPAKSSNPWGGAAYIYALRYNELNRSAAHKAAEKKKFLEEYYWTEEEYNFIYTDLNKQVTPITFNWIHIPDFEYTSLWSVFTEDWSVVKERVNPVLNSALAAQNK